MKAISPVLATILLIVFTIIVGVVISVMINTGIDNSNEKLCTDTGGSVIKSSCCESVGGNFPSNCYMGQCVCSQEKSHNVKNCECEEGKCFIKEKGCVLP